MSTEPPRQAESDRFGASSRFERVGVALGGLLGDGWLRRVLRAVFRRVLRWRTGGGERRVLPHGETVRVAPEVRFLTWNPVEYEAFRGFLRPGDTALDVGANVGAYTILFAQWVSPGGTVLAFEPAPQAQAGLRRQVALNGLQSVVVTAQAAVSDSIGEAEFAYTGVEGTNHLAVTATADDRPIIRVATTTVDAVCEARGVRPRLIKIDVEGAELAVLRGARRTIAAMDADAGIFVEMHPESWRAQGIRREQVLAELALQGLRAIPLRDVPDPWALEGECMRLERG